MNPLAAISLAIFLEASAEGESGGFFDSFMQNIPTFSLIVIIALIVTLFCAPYFYRRALSKRGEKKLSSFLMNDPQTRDLLLEKRKQAQGGTDDGRDAED